MTEEELAFRKKKQRSIYLEVFKTTKSNVGWS
jgi:hypothetical protein